jgi:dihydroorotate dehydrogenase
MIKLSPNEDYVTIAKKVKDFTDYFICGNTGPGLVIDIYSKKPVLAGNYGGMSGPAMKPKIMKMVNDVYETVKDSDIKIVASGGIQCWQDIIEYAIAGASLFEIGTCCFMNLKKDRTTVGRTSKESAEFTQNLWEGVERYLTEENMTLDKLVGSFTKND